MRRIIDHSLSRHHPCSAKSFNDLAKARRGETVWNRPRPCSLRHGEGMAKVMAKTVTKLRDQLRADIAGRRHLPLEDRCGSYQDVPMTQLLDELDRLRAAAEPTVTLRKLAEAVLQEKGEDTYPGPSSTLIELAEAALAQADEPSARQLDTVTGIECMGYMGRHPSGLDTDDGLNRCPFCGHVAAFREAEKVGHDQYTVSVECTNTSCSVRTPQHYANRATAMEAWNRRDPPITLPVDRDPIKNANMKLHAYHIGKGPMPSWMDLYQAYVAAHDAMVELSENRPAEPGTVQDRKEIPCVHRGGCRKFPACFYEERCCAPDDSIPETV